MAKFLTKYLGISYDEKKSVEISEQQFITCQQANRQFAAFMHPSNHVPTDPHVLQLSMPRTKQGLRKLFSTDQEYEQCHHPNINSS